MKRNIAPLFTLVVALAGASAAWAQPAQVLIIRHAEKPDEGDELSVKGRERSAALAPFFMGTDAVLKFQAPVAIYASNPTAQARSVRSVETVQPLATALRLKVNRNYSREQYAGLVDEVLHKPEYRGHTVLICWAHARIPDIAAKLGAAHAPQEWPTDAYDRVWVITFDKQGEPQFKDLPQRLMYGDSDS